MMFFFKGRSVIVAPPVAVKPALSAALAARKAGRVKIRLEAADTSAPSRRLRLVTEDNRLL